MRNSVPAAFTGKTPTEVFDTMTICEAAALPVPVLLSAFGVRLVEVDAGKLAAKGISGQLQGRIGDAVILIERTMPQNEREATVRALVGRLTPTDATVSLPGPYTPDKRLVPATVSGGIVHVECFDWCTTGHMDEDLRNLEDLDHGGKHNDVNVSHMHDNGAPHFLFGARLVADPYSSDPAARRPYVVLNDGLEDVSLTPDQTDATADRLTAVTQQMRGMARIARSYQTTEPAPPAALTPPAAVPNHFPWCAPGACITYERADGPVVEHHSASATIHAPGDFDGHGQIFDAHLSTAADEPGWGPSVSVVTATGNGSIIDSTATLDKLIDETAAALKQLRAWRGELGQAAAVPGDAK
ncbi:hypothetical protein [Streptomyces sp. NPDC091212]|uniref:DUF6907 domain-containing protein n=1 Tax=Streptomyces sp. NPDC091212 TaxID=3155191 RepID=UPI00342E4F1F